VPWSVETDTENKRFLLDQDKERFESAPGFDKDNYPDMADPTWQNTIISNNGTKFKKALFYMEIKGDEIFTDLVLVLVGLSLFNV